MGIQNFNMVLVGSNIPLSTIDLDDFAYRNRPLDAAFRIPVALQAEARGVSLTILAERFQVAVTEPNEIVDDERGLVQLAEAFFGYVGPRSHTAIGHNALFTIDGTSGRKDEIRRALIDMDRHKNSLGVTWSGLTRPCSFVSTRSL